MPEWGRGGGRVKVESEPIYSSTDLIATYLPTYPPTYPPTYLYLPTYPPTYLPTYSPTHPEWGRGGV